MFLEKSNIDTLGAKIKACNSTVLKERKNPLDESTK